MIIDRARFFTSYRMQFGPITEASTVQNIERFLDFLSVDKYGLFEEEEAWGYVGELDVARAAYLLATARHETGADFLPRREHGAARYFDKYDAGTRLGSRLGNVYRGDGLLFRGRGFVQVTGRANYKKVNDAWQAITGEELGLLENPDTLLRPDVAYFSLSYGLYAGLYTGLRLGKIIRYEAKRMPIGEGVMSRPPRVAKAYREARRTVNGYDRADMIADYAVRFEKALKASIQAPPKPVRKAQVTGNEAATIMSRMGNSSLASAAAIANAVQRGKEDDD
jgi:putative chitinase